MESHDHDLQKEEARQNAQDIEYEENKANLNMALELCISSADMEGVTHEDILQSISETVKNCLDLEIEIKKG